MTEKDSEKLSLEEMEETAGGGALDGFTITPDNSCGYYTGKCPNCGEITRIRVGGISLFNNRCEKCNYYL